MNNHRYGRLTFVIGALTFAVIGSALFSLAQSGLPASVPALQEPAFPKVSHPACPDCFTHACAECYVVFEEVPGTGVTLAREIPNPAPFDPDETRLEFDPETGLPIWYIGHQPYVGPTDEQPFSAEFPEPKIVLKRIQARYEEKIAAIPGVHGFGIGRKGFLVFLDRDQLANETLVPKEIEGVPVEVMPGGPFEFLSHQNVRYTPVPTSANVGAYRPEGGIFGTSGPHIVLSSPTRIWTLTAGHIVKNPTESPLTVQGRQVYQPGPGSAGSTVWEVVALSFQQNPCLRTNCVGDLPTSPRVAPDVAAIAHISYSHNEPSSGHTSPAGSLEPIRRMYYGPTSSVNGPSGIAQTVLQGTSVKWWGSLSDAPKGPVHATNVTAYPIRDISGNQFLFSSVDIVRLERSAINGDSGCVVAGNGVSNRHIMGIGIARDSVDFTLGVYHRSLDVQAAIQNANVPFHHWWGTASGRTDIWLPANTQCDGPC